MRYGVLSYLMRLIYELMDIFSSNGQVRLAGNTPFANLCEANTFTGRHQGAFVITLIECGSLIYFILSIISFAWAMSSVKTLSYLIAKDLISDSEAFRLKAANNFSRWKFFSSQSIKYLLA